MMAWFAYFQCAYSIVPNPDGQLLMAVPVSKIRAANKETYPAQQRENPALAFQCRVNGCGELDYCINPQKFSLQKSIFMQFMKLFTCKRNLLYRTLQYIALHNISICIIQNTTTKGLWEIHEVSIHNLRRQSRGRLCILTEVFPINPLWWYSK